MFTTECKKRLVEAENRLADARSDARMAGSHRMLSEGRKEHVREALRKLDVARQALALALNELDR